MSEKINTSSWYQTKQLGAIRTNDNSTLKPTALSYVVNTPVQPIKYRWLTKMSKCKQKKGLNKPTPHYERIFIPECINYFLIIYSQLYQLLYTIINFV